MSYYYYNNDNGGRRGFMSNVPTAVRNIIIINVLVMIMTSTLLMIMFLTAVGTLLMKPLRPPLSLL